MAKLLIDKDARMHCFVLFKYNNIRYHFEHSNNTYESIEKALEDIKSGFEKQDIRILPEISDIPDNITFKEFNKYVNSFDKTYTRLK